MKGKRIATAIACGAIAAISLAGCGGQSLSYKDGYQFAMNDYNSPGGSAIDGSSCLNPKQWMPHGDSPADWQKGCQDGFSAAQNAANHPGLGS